MRLHFFLAFFLAVTLVGNREGAHARENFVQAFNVRSAASASWLQ